MTDHEPSLDIPPGGHRMRRAEDHEEMQIRLRVLAVWTEAYASESPARALWAALDAYKQELGLLALRRLGVGGTR